MACIIEGERRGEDRRGTPADVHHEVKGYRTGHHRTIPLCPWHHRGVPPDAVSTEPALRATLGPSLARNPQAFSNCYGSFNDLWERTELLLGALIRQQHGL